MRDITTIKIYKDTLRKLRIIAAYQSKSMMKALDDIISKLLQEVKDAEP